MALSDSNTLPVASYYIEKNQPPQRVTIDVPDITLTQEQVCATIELNHRLSVYHSHSELYYKLLYPKHAVSQNALEQTVMSNIRDGLPGGNPFWDKTAYSEGVIATYIDVHIEDMLDINAQWVKAEKARLSHVARSYAFFGGHISRLTREPVFFVDLANSTVCLLDDFSLKKPTSQNLCYGLRQHSELRELTSVKFDLNLTLDSPNAFRTWFNKSQFDEKPCPPLQNESILIL